MKNGYQRALALLLSIMMILALYSGVVTVNAGEVTSGDYTGGEVDPQNPDIVCSHEYKTLVPAVASTCHTQGHGAYTVCDACHAIIAGSDFEFPLDPDNHDGETETRNAKPPTCNEKGYTGDTYCLGCGNRKEAGTEIPATGIHTTGDWLCNGDGHWHFCTVCGQDVDKADHTYEWVVTKEATAQENGLKEEICSVCGYKSGNSEEILYSGHIPGDIDGNGVSNNLDLILLFQYLSGWDVADQVDMSAVDVDGSGTPNNLDLIALFQYLSGWGNTIY